MGHPHVLVIALMLLLLRGQRVKLPALGAMISRPPGVPALSPYGAAQETVAAMGVEAHRVAMGAPAAAARALHLVQVARPLISKKRVRSSEPGLV